MYLLVRLLSRPPTCVAPRLPEMRLLSSLAAAAAAAAKTPDRVKVRPITQSLFKHLLYTPTLLFA